MTSKIEKICNGIREVTDKTKVILVNHEFGHPYEHLEALKKYKLPIIEDCAHAFFSKDKNNIMGTIDDFVIYSFSKMLANQIGGLLVSNINTKLKGDLNKETLGYMKHVMSYYINKKDVIAAKRVEVYIKLRKVPTVFF